MPGSVGGTELAAYLDLSDPSFSALEDAVHAARDLNWYARSNYGIVALRHHEVRHLLRDSRLRQPACGWPEKNGITEGPLYEHWSKTITAVSPADHKRLRRLLNPLFAPKAIEAMAPSFRELTNELIDGFASKGRCEFVSEFCSPFAARILLKLLGIPEDNWREMQRMASDFGLAFDIKIVQELPRIEAALAGLSELADALLAERRQNPRDDAIGGLIAACDRGDTTPEELRILIVTLIFGGLHTTKNQLGLALYVFMQHLDQWDLLAAQPELGAGAVEEVMRVLPTSIWITRRAEEDIVVGVTKVPAGTTIHMFTESASTDPLVGGDVDFDITAERPRHLAFGAGPHHCLGHYLARADMREALPILAQRLRNPRLDGDPKFRPWTKVAGPDEIPIAFDPAD